MPTYEYQCDNCGYKFEEFQKMTEAPLKKCPKCKKSGKVHRLISAGAGIIFKGSGFYATDYRSSDYKKRASEEKSSSSSSSSSPATKSTESTSNKKDKKT
ncbi:MAG: FmdB family zinc ribbon protein [bacterium]